MATYKIHFLESGYLSLDGGAMFGTVPKVLWEKYHQPDEYNRIPLSMRTVLLESQNRLILIDCGLGDKGNKKFRDMFNVQDQEQSLLKSFTELGKTFEEVTDVVLTHLHFDHAGGATQLIEGGAYRPAFPNAKYHIQEKNLALAKAPNSREKASYLPEIYESIDALDKFICHKGEQMNVLPDIDFWVSSGHTEAQQHPLIKMEDATYFYCGDLIPTAAHIKLPWIMGYDVQPLEILKEKERVLKAAYHGEWKLIFEHDIHNVYGSVTLNQNGHYEYVPEKVKDL